MSWSRFKGNGPAWKVNLHEREVAPALPPPMAREPRDEPARIAPPQLTPLARADGDKLNCAGLTREAAIEVMKLAGGAIFAGIIVDKLESERKPNGPEREAVIAWLCANKLAWRPKGASEARLTPAGRAKAQSILIHVSAGNY